MIGKMPQGVILVKKGENFENNVVKTLKVPQDAATKTYQSAMRTELVQVLALRTFSRRQQ